MPKRFDAELDRLNDMVVDMGKLAEEMLRTVMRALVERDEALLDQVPEMEERVDRYQIEVDDRVIRLMTIYGPVAMDLRFVLMVARINTEIERIGDQACNMREHIKHLLSEPELKKLEDLPRMAEIASKMVHGSMKAFRKRAVDRTADVIDADTGVDDLHRKVFDDLLEIMSRDATAVPRAVALLFIARSLERIADHATNISEEVVYMVKGEDIRHEELQQAAHGQGT